MVLLANAFSIWGVSDNLQHFWKLERAKGFEPERALHANNRARVRLQRLDIGAGEGIRTLDPDLGKVVLYP